MYTLDINKNIPIPSYSGFNKIIRPNRRSSDIQFPDSLNSYFRLLLGCRYKFNWLLLSPRTMEWVLSMRVFLSWGGESWTFINVFWWILCSCVRRIGVSCAFCDLDFIFHSRHRKTNVSRKKTYIFFKSKKIIAKL